MTDLPLSTLLLLHGATGGWDELLMLVAGVGLAVFVVKWTQRSAKNQAAEESESEPIEGIESQRAEPR